MPVEFAYDSHCHLEYIKTIECHTMPAIIPGVSLTDHLELVQIRQSYPGYKIGFGLHPWFINAQSLSPDDLLTSHQLGNQLTDLAKQYKPDFIGEIGLDKYKPDFDLQVKLFESQLLVAKQFDLPVVIHCVKAYNEVLSIIKTYDIHRGIIHGFNANSLIAKDFYCQGFLLGIGSHITKQSILSGAISDIPSSHIALESDAPYMPAFGKNTSKSRDCFLYAQLLAAKQNINLIDVINQSNQNVIKLFNNRQQQS